MKKDISINLGTFNFIKGLALISIVIGHMMYNYDTTTIMSIFPLNFIIELQINGGMPLFFLIAGVYFRERKAHLMLKKSFSDCVRPYITVMLSVITLFTVFHFITYKWLPGTFSETLKYIIGFLLGLPRPGKNILGINVYDAQVVWFFLAMFIATNLLNMIVKIKNKYMQAGIVTVATIAGYLLATFDFTYFCLPQGLMGLGFCYVGYMVKNYNLINQKINILLIPCVLIVFLFQVKGGMFAMAYLMFSHGYFSYIAAVCTAIVLMYIGVYTSTLKSKVADLIKKIGLYSYWVMCVHAVELTSIPWYRLQQITQLPQIAIFCIELALKIIIISTSCIAIKKFTVWKLKRRLVNATK